MSNTEILKDKPAVVFGAGGSIGSTTAKKLGGLGAEVFLAGRTESTLAPVAEEISDSGGRAGYTVVDALDDGAVDEYLRGVVEQAGRIDIEFNATGPPISEYGAGTPALELPVEQLVAAQKVLISQFITARCAARRMVLQGAGVIIFLTGSPARPHTPGGTSIGAAFGGIETVMRSR